jgi:hypothetical protein
MLDHNPPPPRDRLGLAMAWVMVLAVFVIGACFGGVSTALVSLIFN